MFEKLLKSKLFLYALIVSPGLYGAYQLFGGSVVVAADPAKYILEYSGKTATLLFIAVLSLTPLRRIGPQIKWIRALNGHRRLIGVSSFVYGLIHFAFYIIWKGGLFAFWEDAAKPFVLSGIIALVLLFVLAITSLNWIVRKMGYRRWKWLHRLAYVIAFLLAYHQGAQEKLGTVQTVYFFAPLVLLQIWRVVSVARGR